MSNINANITDYLKQIESLTSTNLQILKTINDSFFTKKSHLYAEIDNETFLIPSFISLENKINMLQENFENLVHAPATGEAHFNFNGNSRAIEVRKYNCTPEHVVLPYVENFYTERNDIFKDFLTPIPYINLDLPTIPNDITDVNVKKIVVKSEALKNVFKEKLEDYSSISENYSDIAKLLYNYNEGKDYEEYDSVYKLPTHKNVGTGTYEIESVISDEIDDDLNEFFTLKIADDLTYYLFDETLTKDLQVGDELVNYDASGKVVITEINKESNTIVVKVVNGEYLNFLGTDSYEFNDNGEIHELSLLRFFAGVDLNDNKYVKVPLEEDQYIFIAAAPINQRMNIQSAWGIGLIIDTHSLINSNNETQKFKEYYDKNVQNIGDIIFEMTSVITTPITSLPTNSFEKITSYRPRLNKNDLTVIQINKHLNNSPAVETIRKTYNQKKEAEAELKNIQAKLYELNTKLSSTKFNAAVSVRNTYLTEQSDLIRQKESLIATINSAIDEITLSANRNEIPIDNAKYRIRGFYKVPNFTNTDLKDLISEDNVIGINVQYRYKNISSKYGYVVSYNAVDEKYIYSDWNTVYTPLRNRIATIKDGEYTYKYEETNENNNEPSYNQIDIPISQGETVDIRLKLVYDYGQPFVNVSSRWSNIISISFPEEFINDIDIKKILTEISTNVATNKLNSLLESNGVNKHIDDSILEATKIYYHKPEHISSGFMTENNQIISLKDKLISLENDIALLKNDVFNQTSTYEVSLSVGDNAKRIYPNTENVFALEAYDSFSELLKSDNLLTSGPYTIKNGVLHTTININIKNTGTTALKLYSIFPGRRSILINDTKTNLANKLNYCVNKGGVWYGYKGISESGGAMVNHGYQTQNQFITFRVNDPWDGTKYYADDNSASNGSKNNLTDAVLRSDELPTIDSSISNAMYVYPFLMQKDMLCLDSDDIRTYKVVNPGEELTIPLYCEYKVSTAESQVYKTMSFDLRTNMHGDFTNFTYTIVASNQKGIYDIIDNNFTPDNSGSGDSGTDTPTEPEPGEPEYMKDDYNPNPNYLTIVALEDGLKVEFNNDEYYGIYYGKNGEGLNTSLNYIEYNEDTKKYKYATSESINKGEYISLRMVHPGGTGKSIGTFSINKKCKLTGNCNSMLFGDELIDNEGKTKSLVGYNYIFNDLFKDCKTIENVHKDFLPSKKLADYCYAGMFYGCTGLKSAPKLLAANVESGSYNRMFKDCNNLNYVKMMATKINGNLESWLENVADEGTLVIDANAKWTKEQLQMPEGWEIDKDVINNPPNPYA